MLEIANGIAARERCDSGSDEYWIAEVMIKSILALLVVTGAFGALAGCNTVDGMGKDLGAAGAATADTARDVGKRM